MMMIKEYTPLTEISRGLNMSKRAYMVSKFRLNAQEAYSSAHGTGPISGKLKS